MFCFCNFTLLFVGLIWLLCVFGDDWTLVMRACSNAGLFFWCVD